MTDIIAIANPQGGSAKTSTAVNLSCALAATRRKVLLVDLDPQCSSTVALNFPRGGEENSLAGVLISGNPIKDTILRYHLGSFDVITANEDLTAVPVALYNEMDGNFRLRHSLSEIAANYDYIFLDCPPSAGSLTINALCAADYLIIPMPCEFFALDSMLSLVSLYQRLNASGEAQLKLLGIVRTIYDESRNLSKEISDELKVQFKDLLFDSVIAYNEKISEATSAGRPIMLYDKSSTGARAYLTLAGELLQKMRQSRMIR